MSAKGVTISVRIDQNDAAFIAGLKLPGATTPSDKLRAIIQRARERETGETDMPSSHALMKDLLAKTETQVRDLQHQQGTYSELVSRSLEWLPELAAYLISAHAVGDPKAAKSFLPNLESGIADRIFRLLEFTLRLGTTRTSPCYDPQLVLRRIEPILELARIVEATRNNTQEKSG